MSNYQIFLLVFLLSLSFSYLIWRLRYKSRQSRFYPVLAYHKITDAFEWGITRVRPQSFEQQVKHLKEEGFSSMDLSELAVGAGIGFSEFGSIGPAPNDIREFPRLWRGLDDNFPNEQNDKWVAITFDDGYESVYQNAFPILNQYGFSATIFLITGFVGKKNLWEANFGRRFRHLDWEEIQELKKSGCQFGSHTVNHPDLTKLNQRSLEFELKKSKETIEEKLNQEVKFLSYPFGRHNRLVRTEVKNAGYKAAFTLSSEISSDPFAIGRLGIYLFDTPLSLRIKLNPKGLFCVEDLKGWIINQFSAGTSLVKRYKDQNP